MEPDGKIRQLTDERGPGPNLWVQRDTSHIDLGLEHLPEDYQFTSGAGIDLTAAEARQVAHWLLAAADEVERYSRVTRAAQVTQR